MRGGELIKYNEDVGTMQNYSLQPYWREILTKCQCNNVLLNNKNEPLRLINANQPPTVQAKNL
jgi:hypothetical protein